MKASSLRDILQKFKNGAISFDSLVAAVRLHAFSQREHGETWAEVWAIADRYPDDNAFYWIESALSCGVIEWEQYLQLYAAAQLQRGCVS